MDNRKTDSIFKVNNVHFLFPYNDNDRREQRQRIRRMWLLIWTRMQYFTKKRQWFHSGHY